jgi:iron complex outermembrane recepter protein
VNPWEPEPGAFVDLAGTFPRYRTFTRQYSVFAEDRLAFTERWSIVGGLRLDRAQMRRDDLVQGASLFEETLQSTGGRVGLVYRHSPALSFYGQYSRGADPLGSLITLSVAQKDFDLSTGDQVEVGVKQSFLEDRGEWTFAAYDITKKRLLTRVQANPNLTQQIGERSSRGLEASVALRPTASWLVEANMSVLHAKFDDFTEVSGGTPISRNGRVPPNVPEQLANLWATWHFAPGWHVQAGARYVGKTYSDNANTFEIPDYTVVDASVGWTFSQNVLVSLRGYNLFDEVYATTTYNDEQWLLGRPRSMEMTVNARF